MKLSLGCALLFVAALIGLPLLNYFYPELMARRIGGFTLTWFLVGVAIFPYVWVISFYFIKRSISLEEQEVREVEQMNRRG